MLTYIKEYYDRMNAARTNIPYRIVWDEVPAWKHYFRDGMASVITNPNYYALASIIELVVLSVIIYVWSPLGVSDKYPALSIIFLLFILCIQTLTYMFVKQKDVLREQGLGIIKVNVWNMFIKVYFTLFTICMVVLFIYIFVWVFTAYSSIGSTMMYIIDFAITIGLISCIYLVMKPLRNTADTTRVHTFMSLASAFILYLPCLFIDFTERVKHEYNITTKTIWLILAGEMIFITLRILLPKLMLFAIQSSGTQLLRDPVYLDTRHELGSYDIIHSGVVDKGAYTYSISAWFWINPQPSNTRASYSKYTNILEFGRKPSIEYNGLENSLRVNCQIIGDTEVTLYETNDVKYQTWNNIVINYDGSTMDVFLNGLLVGSKPNIAPYMTMENVVVGSMKGIEGGICNVMFHRDIMKQRHIMTGYKTLKSLPLPSL